MANYDSAARSSYAKFKPEYDQLIRSICSDLSITITTIGPGIAFLFEDSIPELGLGPDGQFLPFDSDQDPESYVDFPAWVSQFLEDNQALIFMQSGHEKLRSIHGYASSWTNKGMIREILLDDLEIPHTTAEY